MPIDNTPRLCLCMSAISESNIRLILLKSGLHWKMHPAQLFSLENASLNNTTVVTTTVKDEETKELMSKTPITLYGMPVQVSAEHSEYKISLYHDDKLVCEIDGIAVPNGF